MRLMPFKRMKFKGNRVFVEMDEDGKLVIVEGRAQMKYRLEDTCIYSPSPKNLSEMDDLEGSQETSKPTAKRRATRGKSNPEGTTKSATKGTARRAPTVTDDTTIAYTDGACSGNPGPAGLGYVVVFPDGKCVQRGEPLGIATNNIAELTAIMRVLELVDSPSSTVIIHTDSAYSIGVLSQGWKAKANKELIFEIKQLLSRLPNVTLRKVKGHAGVPENELVDHLARSAAETQKTVKE
jgi:ribonuclease HI